MTTGLFLWMVGHRALSIDVIRDAASICEGYPATLLVLLPLAGGREPANGRLHVAR